MSAKIKLLLFAALLRCSESAITKTPDSVSFDKNTVICAPSETRFIDLKNAVTELGNWEPTLTHAIQNECLKSVENNEPESSNGNSEKCVFVKNTFLDFQHTILSATMSQKVENAITLLKTHIQELNEEFAQRQA